MQTERERERERERGRICDSACRQVTIATENLTGTAHQCRLQKTESQVREQEDFVHLLFRFVPDKVLGEGDDAKLEIQAKNVNAITMLWVNDRALENPKLTFSNNVKLRAGINKISLLSVVIGLLNVGVHYATLNTAVLGPVTLEGHNERTRDLTNQMWSYKVPCSTLVAETKWQFLSCARRMG
ncbi:hypothetical protein RHSIM_RhsimUnG0061700 [Rhododendron simsii]|uniref:Uncharacterized protein n=1 Tax=Rhododendron simsii TaxID=118357 RepID=A0A834FW62_RHOSS|nr:hypothetical protein RHSIM_RhsimUnG0061700 [Rhododendron simsii]